MVSLLLLATLAVPAQPTGGPPSFNVMVLTLFAAEDPALVKELGLSDEQVKALQEHRKTWLANYHKLGFNDRYNKRGELGEANDKALAKILTDKQLPLLRKRLLWESCNRFGEFRTLRYPDVAKELGLDEQQLTKLQAGESAGEILSDDQKKKWTDLRGKRPAEPLKLSTYQEGRTTPAEVNPEWLMLVVLPAVQDELKLNDKQKAAIDEQAKKWVKAAPAVLFAKAEQLKAVIDPIEKAVDDALDEGQRKRLGQLQKQKAIPHSMGFFWVAAFSNETFQKEAALTSEQKHKVENLDTVFLKAVVKAASKSETADELLITARKLAANRQDDLLKLLEPDQKKKVDDLYGPAFLRRFPLLERTSLIPNELVFAKPALLVLLPEMIGDSLSKGLNLSKETKDELTKLNAEVQRVVVKGETPAQQYENRQSAYADYVKQIEKILGKEKFERATQILLQLIDNPQEGTYEFRTQLLARWPEMVRELQLSAEQLDLLYEVNNLRDVLTPDQIKMVEKRSGEPHKASFTRPAGASTLLSEPPETYLLKQPAVRKELQLSDEQQKKVEVWIDEWHEVAHQASYWRDPTRKDKAKKLLEDQLDGILKEAQRTRLQQIERQVTSREAGLLNLLSDDKFLKVLAPTDDEKEKLTQLRSQRSRVYLSIGRYMSGYSTRKQNDDDMAILRELHGADSQRVEKLLGEATAKRLKELFGEPFDGVSDSMLLSVIQQMMTGFQLIEFGPPY